MNVTVQSNADDELAKYAAAGNKVGVDGQCFFKKCALETSSCANNPSCLKGLACLARCKGGSMCSTGCFAKHGGPELDNMLHCSVEKNNCVQVPGKGETGWTQDTLADIPTKPLSSFDMKSLEGKWFKVMGLDSRYDCFDCQKNSFIVKDDKTLKMEAFFRIPRPASSSSPGYLQSKIVEELHKTDRSKHLSHMQSSGQMFCLTFWENWYVIGQSKPSNLHIIANKLVPQVSAASSSGESSGNPSNPEFKLIFYTGHTLQGSYKGRF